MEYEKILINNLEFRVNSLYRDEIQTLIDEIVTISKMIDEVKSIDFDVDAHTAILRYGYKINVKNSKLKFMFFSHYDYVEKKYKKNNIMNGLTFHFSDDLFFNFENLKIQVRGLNHIKTNDLESVVEILKRIKNFILVKK
jgi:hypothetical protein